MTLPDRETTRDWLGQTVVDRDGSETGVCRALLADDATGLPEWLYADLDGETVVIPLLGATGAGDRIRVTVRREAVVSSPRMGEGTELSAAQETALYEHYGISYSTAASETVLPVGGDGTPDPAVATTSSPPPSRPSPDRPSPDRPSASRPSASRPAPSDAGSPAAPTGRGPLAGVLAVLGILGVLGTAVLRRRAARRVPQPVGRRARVAARASAARARGRVQSGALSAAARQRLDEAAGVLVPKARAAGDTARERAAEFVTAAAPVVAAAGREAQRAASAGAVTAAHAAGTTARIAAATLSSGAALGADLGQAGLRAAMGALGAVEAVPEAVAESTDHLQKGWRRLMSRLSLGLGLAVGYVLGARDGRERFDQMASTAAGLAGRPEVQRAVGAARSAVPPKLQSTLDGLRGRTPGGAGDTERVIAVDSAGEATPESPRASAASTEPSPDLPGQGL